jgi:release factor glutamine methyltransferase
MAFLTIREALRQGSLLVDSRLAAEVLLAHAMHVERSYFYAHPEQELREVEWIHYGRYLHERSQGKPTQYITHKQEFYGREFRVTPDVLIPRPETEHLVEAALELPGGTVVDVGSGSGAIAVTLALERKARVIAVDVSAAALSVTRENATRLGAEVVLVLSDLLSAFSDESVNLIVSNPPYIAHDARPGLQREVRDWEPGLALFGGRDGLEVYRRLIPEAWRVLRPGGHLALELGYDSLAAVEAMLPVATRRIEDLAGIVRVLVCQKA